MANSIVISALRARSNFGKILQRVEDEQQSLVIEKRGTPRAVLLSIRDYLKLAVPEPAVMRAIGYEAAKAGANRLTSAQIDRIIKATRSKKHNR